MSEQVMRQLYQKRKRKKGSNQKNPLLVYKRKQLGSAMTYIDVHRIMQNQK